MRVLGRFHQVHQRLDELESHLAKINSDLIDSVSIELSEKFQQSINAVAEQIEEKLKASERAATLREDAQLSSVEAIISQREQHMMNAFVALMTQQTGPLLSGINLASIRYEEGQAVIAQVVVKLDRLAKLIEQTHALLDISQTGERLRQVEVILGRIGKQIGNWQ